MSDVFKDLDEAVDWLYKHDPPEESEYNCNIKHRIRFGDDDWFEFSSDTSLKEWIEYDYHQMNPEEESK